MAIQPAAGTSLTTTDNRHLHTFLSTLTNPHTRRAYQRDVTHLSQWLTEAGDGRPFDLLALNTNGAANWTRHMLEELDLSTATVARRQAGACRFYTWAGRSNLIDRGANPFSRDNLDRVTASSDPTDEFPVAGVNQLLNELDGLEWRTIALLANAGLRVSEACDAVHGDLVDTGQGWEIRVVGKGRKSRRVALPPGLVARLGHAPPDRRILLDDGRAVEPYKVRRIVARAGRAVGVRHAHPHMLRVTFITELLAQGAPLWAVQDAAGHSDPRTTRGYQRRAQSAAARQAMAAGLWAAYQDA